MKCAICGHVPDPADPEDDLIGCPTCGRFTCAKRCADLEFGYCRECSEKEAAYQRAYTGDGHTQEAKT